MISKQKTLYILSFMVFFLTILCPLWYFHSNKALGQIQPVNDSTQVILMVANCNNNGICEPQFGENYLGCAADCPPPPPPPPPPQTTTSSHTHIFRSNTFLVSVIPTTSGAYISWTSKVSTRGTLIWGLTSDLELGAIAELDFGTDHGIQLNNLYPGTRYFYRIESTGTTGIKYYAHGEFFTLPSPDTIPPNNVSGIHIELKNNNTNNNYNNSKINSGNGNYVLVSWTNPTDPDFANVRVVKSSGFYFDRPSGGKIIYEGTGTSFEDHYLQNDVDYFYTFFVQDVDGNYSSGAVAHFKLVSISKNNYIETNINFGGATTTQSEYFNLSDLEMMQWRENVKELQHLFLSNDIFDVDRKTPILILLRKEKLFPDAESILFSVQDENDSSHFNSYLIRSLRDKNSLEVSIPAFQKEGSYSFFITFLNKDRHVLNQTHGSFNVRNFFESSSFSLWYLIRMWISQIIQWFRAFWAMILG